MRSQSRSYCFPMNFAKFVRNTFFTEISGRLLLFRLKCKLKLWLQSKRIYTPLLTNFHIWINTIATTAKNLKFYSKWAVRSIVHLAHSKIDCSLVKRVIAQWHMCKSVHLEVSCGRNELFWDAWLVLFLSRKKFLVNSLERTCCFRK